MNRTSVKSSCEHGSRFYRRDSVVFISDFRCNFKKAIRGDIGIILTGESPCFYTVWNERTGRILYHVPDAILYKPDKK